MLTQKANNSAKEETESLKAEIKYSSVEELLNAAKACADRAEQIKSEIDLAQSELSNAKSNFDGKVSAENETAKQLKSFESELENKKSELDMVLSENNILECPDFNLLTEDSIKELKREAETFTDSRKNLGQRLKPVKNQLKESKGKMSLKSMD